MLEGAMNNRPAQPGNAVRRASTRQQIRPATAALIMAILLSGLWALEVVDQLSGNALDDYGIQARSLDGLAEVFTAPLLHAGWDHLVANSLPFFVLGLLVLLGGLVRWLLTTLVSVVASGISAWLLTPANTVVLGASGLIFGWLTYLIVRGFWSRNPRQIVVGLIVLLFYGGMIWGVLPTEAGVSWQAHLGGAIGGVAAAAWLHRSAVRAQATQPRVRHLR